MNEGREIKRAIEISCNAAIAVKARQKEIDLDVGSELRVIVRKGLNDIEGPGIHYELLFSNDMAMSDKYDDEIIGRIPQPDNIHIGSIISDIICNHYFGFNLPSYNQGVSYDTEGTTTI